jgi:undecaprenyl-diphosphatase
LGDIFEMTKTMDDRWPGKAFRWMLDLVHSVLAWIGQYELSILAGLLLVVGGSWGFIKLADEVVEGDTDHFDEWAVGALREPSDPANPLGPGWLEEVGRDLTALGGFAVLALLTLAVAGFLWLRGMYQALALLTVAVLGGLALSFGLKDFFDRPRPSLVPHLAFTYTSSFPSGHSMLSATVFLTLGVLLGQFVKEAQLKAYFLIVAVTLTLLVGMSRVYLGVHYPTDVLAGWAAGLVWAVTCWLVARYLQSRGLARPRTSDP